MKFHHHPYSPAVSLKESLPMMPSPSVRGTSLAHWIERLNGQLTMQGFGGFAVLVAGLLAFSPLIDGGTTQLPVLIIRLALLASMAGWLLARMKQGAVLLPRTRLDACALAFVCWAVLSLSWAPYKNGSLQWVLSLLSYAAFFVIVTHGLQTSAQMWAPLSVVTCMGVFQGMLGVAQYVVMDEPRARGTFFNPNFFSAYEAAVFGLSMGILLFTKRALLPGHVRRWLWVAAAVSLTAVVIGQSRGASVALVGAVFFLGFSCCGKKALAVVALCVSAAFLMPNPLQHRIAHVAAEDPYAYTRLDIWKSALVRLADEPLGIGIGMFKHGSFQERFPIEGNIVRYGKRPESAHNEYLQIGVELGIVGLVLSFCIVGLWAVEVKQLLREPTVDHGLVMGLTASVLVLLLHAAMDSSLHEPALVVLLLLTGGLIHNLYLRARPEAVLWWPVALTYHPFRAACVVAGVVVIGAVCAQSTIAWFAHEEGKRHAARTDLHGAFAWYVRAARIDPGTTGYHDSIARTALQLYSESGVYDWLLQAAEEESIAKKLNPVDARFAYRSGSIYGLMATQARTNAQRDELLSKAADAYADAIRLDPHLAFSYFELARLRLAEGRVQAAMELLSAAKVHEPNFLPGRVLLAELSIKAGIAGDYAKEMASITDIRLRYEPLIRDEIERQFLNVDLDPLQRVIARKSQS